MLGKKQKPFRPLADRLIVRPNQEQAEMTQGGLYIPVMAQEKTQQGEVVAVGPGRVTDQGVTIPMTVQAGQQVMYGKYAGTPLELDGEEVLVIRESDVILVL
jgi:chaperonin GroES